MKPAHIYFLRFSKSAVIVHLLLILCLNVGSLVIPENDTDIFGDNVQNYLSQFGYLPKGDPLSRNQRHETEVRRALQQLQDFAGLNATGTLDPPTRTLLASKRCGIPDVGRIDPVNEAETRKSGLRSTLNRRWKRYVSRWQEDIVKYSVQSYPSTLGPGRVRRSIYDAMQLWNGASRLRFQETADHSDSDIIVSFAEGSHGDGYPFDGPDVILAHAYFPGAGMGGDIHFDGSEEWIDRLPVINDQVHLYSVAAHEIGHALGLAHEKSRDSLMFPYYYKLDATKTKLPYMDVMNLQKLYGKGDATVPPTPATTTTQRTTTRPKPRTRKPIVDTPPDPCEAKPDAISMIRNEIVVFQGKYFWRMDSQGYLVERPMKISRFWYGLPEDLTHIDAIYEKPDKDRIVIFIGKQYWEFALNFPTPGYPKPISELGLPADLDHVDTAFVWGYNGKLYYFAGEQYWRVDSRSSRVEPDYPRHTKVWKGVPMPVRAAFTDHEDDTYFLSEENVYKFHGWFMKVQTGWPKPIKDYWPSCDESKQRIIEHGSNG